MEWSWVKDQLHVPRFAIAGQPHGLEPTRVNPSEFQYDPGPSVQDLGLRAIEKEPLLRRGTSKQ